MNSHRRGQSSPSKEKENSPEKTGVPLRRSPRTSKKKIDYKQIESIKSTRSPPRNSRRAKRSPRKGAAKSGDSIVAFGHNRKPNIGPRSTSGVFINSPSSDQARSQAETGDNRALLLQTVYLQQTLDVRDETVLQLQEENKNKQSLIDDLEAVLREKERKTLIIEADLKNLKQIAAQNACRVNLDRLTDRKSIIRQCEKSAVTFNEPKFSIDPVVIPRKDIVQYLTPKPNPADWMKRLVKTNTLWLSSEHSRLKLTEEGMSSRVEVVNYEFDNTPGAHDRSNVNENPLVIDSDSDGSDCVEVVEFPF